MKKTLIINGSPRLNGDSAALVRELKKHLHGDIVEISAFYSNISPCLDCQSCHQTGRCALKDDMDIIYNDDFDNVVLAAPVYYCTLPGQVLSLMSRFQAYRAHSPAGSRRVMKEKKGGLILTSGGKGNEAGAEHHIKVFFRMLNAHGFEDHRVTSTHTDTLPAALDIPALFQARELAAWLECDDPKHKAR